MSDEKSIVFKKFKKVEVEKVDTRYCIIHYLKNTSDKEIRPLTEQSVQTITKCKAVRQSQNDARFTLDEICSSIPDIINYDIHGVHRWCYQNFTNITRLNKRTFTEVDSNEKLECTSGETQRRSRRCPATSTSSAATSNALFPRNECIFCGKGRRRSGVNLEELRTCVTENAEINIKNQAVIKNDFELLGKIDGINLRAREARYHEQCRREYIRQEYEPISTDSRKVSYATAFNYLSQYIYTNIIIGCSVVRMSMLKDIYLEYVEEHFPNYYNPDYQTQKLKKKIVSAHGDKLKFWRPNYRSELVFSSSLEIGVAVELAFEAVSSETRILEDAARILRRSIQSAHSTSPEMPWPPSAGFLTSGTISPPECLKDFLALIISGKTRGHTDKTIRLAGSFAEDICTAATQGKWKLPKHLLLSETLHSYGSSDLVTTLNRFGHCQSYPLVLELETAMANQVQLEDSCLPSNIIPSANKVSNLCWDNFDILEETPSGAGTTHTTHGIIIQELNTSEAVNFQEVHLARTKEKSIKYSPSELPPCYAKKRAEPLIAVTLTGDNLFKNDRNLLCVEAAWQICRSLYNKSFTVPEWSGWISKTAATTGDIKESVIGYMAPILHPITDYSTVQQCLKTSLEVSRKLNQQYTFVTMDLAAAKIAYDIQWQNSELFSNIIINLGAFHTMCSYMGSLGKMMAGSGFEDIVIESGVCASGSIEKVMSGKHFNRAMRVHQRMNEAIQRLLIQSFIETTSENSDTSEREFMFHELTELASSPSYENLQRVTQSSQCTTFLESFISYRCEVRSGKLGCTAQFWLMYSDCVILLLRYQQSVKENNFSSYVKSLHQLCSLIFSADHQNYARYLPVFASQLSNLCYTHPGAENLLKDNGFSVCRSNIPACRNAIDLTIEQTINRSAKTRGGIVGFSRNASAYYRWCLTRHKRASYVDATLERADMISDKSDIHKSNRPIDIRRSEADISNLVTAFNQFINPFKIEEHNKDLLFCLSSGKPASNEVAKDLLNYVATGEKAAESFVKTRLVERTAKLQDPMKRLNLKTFKSLSAVSILTTTQKKTIQVKAERNLLGNLFLLSQKHDINMEKLFTYPLSPIPWSLATADGSLVKTDKSQLMHILESNITYADKECMDNITYIIDGNAHFQSLVQLPASFEELAYQIFNSLPKTKVIHFVTDTYKSNSIKQLERNRRGSCTTFNIGGPKTKLPREFSKFLLNSENKRQLINFLLGEWQKPLYAQSMKGRQIYFVAEESCLLLESSDGANVSVTSVHDLFSSQEEADTRIILHSLFSAQSSSPESSIIIRSPDTDVLIILISYSSKIPQTLLFDTGVGNKRRLLNIKSIVDVFNEEVAKALPGFHAFTGCDTTSAFVMRGKKKPFNILKNSQKHLTLFQSFGSAPTFDDNLLPGIQRFVCQMYGKANSSETNRVRLDIFKERYESKSANSLSLQTGVDMSLLPPCKGSLRMHCLRANYQAFIWKHSDIPNVIIPSPIGLGWKMDAEGNIAVDWIEGDIIMPQQVIDIIDSSNLINIPENEDNTGHEEDREEIVEEDFEIDNILDIMFEDDQSD